MNPYLISGPESLLKAAFEEIEAAGVFNKICSPAGSDYKNIIVSKFGDTWLTQGDGSMVAGKSHLTLPADWDKLMSILAELKKTKLPEYVRAKGMGFNRVAKVVQEAEADNYECLTVYGIPWFVHSGHCTPITEQEFIEGGLKELAEAGYVNGAHYAYEGQDKGNMVVAVCYRNHSESPCSYVVMQEIKRVGFAFCLDSSGGFKLPVSSCTLIPTLPTTSQGIPYVIKEHQVYVGGTEPVGQPMTIVQLNRRTLAYLLRQGVTGLVTNAGQLTKADLELLTK